MTQIENAEGWWLYVAWRLSNWELAAQGEDPPPKNPPKFLIYWWTGFANIVEILVGQRTVLRNAHHSIVCRTEG